MASAWLTVTAWTEADTPRTQDREIRRSVPIPPSVSRAYADSTRSPDGQPGPRYWQLEVNYLIHARLDPTTSVVGGRETVVVHNASDAPLDEVRMRFDQNLFREEAPRTISVPEYTDGMVVTALSIDGVPSTLPGPETNQRFPLPEPLAPNDSSTIEVEWHFRVPLDERSSAIRLGRWADSVYQVAQWYPRVSVHDDLNGWDTASYHGGAEFYNNFGRFEVFLDVPAGWLVGATGELQNPEAVLTVEALDALRRSRATGQPSIIAGGSGRRDAALRSPDRAIWHFVADTVSDFAWGASDRYEWRIAWANIPGRGRIPVHVFQTAPDAVAYPSAAVSVARYLEVFSQRLIPYPFPQLSIVEGPERGMEYPGLFMSSGGGPLAHEAAHEWFPLTVGSDETRHAFMDEGFATAMTSLLRTDAGAQSQNPRLEPQYGASFQSDRAPPVLSADNQDRLTIKSYSRPRHLLRMLGGVVGGDDTVWAVLSDYAAAWRFRHPSPWDLMEFVSEAVDQDLGWFWYYWLFENASVDGSIVDVVPNRLGGTVTVRQDGAMPSPVVLAVQCSSGGGPVGRPDSGYLLDDSTVVVTRLVDEWFDGSSQLTLDLDLGCEIGRVTWDPARRFPDRDACDNVWPAQSRPMLVPQWPPQAWLDGGLVCE